MPFNQFGVVLNQRFRLTTDEKCIFSHIWKPFWIFLLLSLYFSPATSCGLFQSKKNVVHHVVSVSVAQTEQAKPPKESRAEEAYQECNRFNTIEALKKYYFRRLAIPLNTMEAEAHGWIKIAIDKVYSLEVYRFQNSNNLFIFFYKKNLAGVGPIYRAEDVSRQKPPTKGRSWKRFTPLPQTLKNGDSQISGKGNFMHKFNQQLEMGFRVYSYAMILFIDPEILLKKEPDPCSKNIVYFEGPAAGKWILVPFSIKNNEVGSGMEKQGCLNKYGNYYFYNLKDDTVCDNIHGFFSFYDNDGDLTGFGSFYLDNDELAYMDENHPNPVYLTYNIAQVKDMVTHNEACFFKPKAAAKTMTAINFFLKPKSEADNFKCILKDGRKR